MNQIERVKGREYTYSSHVCLYVSSRHEAIHSQAFFDRLSMSWDDLTDILRWLSIFEEYPHVDEAKFRYLLFLVRKTSNLKVFINILSVE